MIYSVWNQGAWKYDYYQSPSVQDTVNAPAPAHMAAAARANSIGISPDAACWPLPRDATKVGSGDVPRGRIASKKRGAGAALGGLPLIGDDQLPLLGALALAGFIVWRTKR